MNDLMPGMTGDDRIKQAKRLTAREEIQQRIGPIVGIENWADSALFGMRDALRQKTAKDEQTGDGE